jgi:protein-tyrosine phosphatase
VTVRVLHVCTGNICRSPIAERLMRAGLQRLGADAARFLVESAGTWGHSGAAMEREAAAVLQEYGVDGSDFRARALVAEHVVQADLVLGATREHRAAAVVLHPRAARKAFTLREFARLTSAVDPGELTATDPEERFRQLVDAAAGNRGLVPPAAPGDDDLADPYQRPQQAFAETAALVQASLQRPLDLLSAPVQS